MMTDIDYKALAFGIASAAATRAQSEQRIATLEAENRRLKSELGMARLSRDYLARAVTDVPDFATFVKDLIVASTTNPDASSSSLVVPATLREHGLAALARNAALEPSNIHGDTE